MKVPLRSPRRRALACLALLCTVLPAAALTQRLTVFFDATFDVAGAPGSGTLPAEVGQFGIVSQPTEFSVVPGDGGGELKIDDHGAQGPAVLEALFKKPFKGQELQLEWTVQALQCDAMLTVSAQDAADTGLIDCTLDDDGTLDVDGLDTGFHYQAGTAYDLRMELRSPLIGPGSWTLQVSSKGVLLHECSGPFAPQDFSVCSMRFTRPAAEHVGEFLLDDISASTYAHSAKH